MRRKITEKTRNCVIWRQFSHVVADMVITFDTTLFLHALYVGFVYAVLALGALWYRQVIDDLAVREIRLGEDIYRAYNPLGWLSSGGFFLFFSIFAAVALGNPSPSIIIYVVPVAAAINVVQMTVRTFRQTIDLRTNGILIRYLLKDAPVGICYDNLIKIEIQRMGSWNHIRFFEFPSGPRAQCYLSEAATDTLRGLLERNTACDVIVG